MKTAVIVGASTGMGLEFAKQYQQQGYRVVASYRSEIGKANLEALGVEAHECDVRDPSHIHDLSLYLNQDPVDLFIYTAGCYAKGFSNQIPTNEDFDRMMQTNVLGAMQCIPLIAPLVEKTKGRMVFLTSKLAQIDAVASGKLWTYRVSKAALNMAVTCAQQSYRDAILVAMSPGWVQTAMGSPMADWTPAQACHIMRRTIDQLDEIDQGQFLHPDGKHFETW